MSEGTRLQVRYDRCAGLDVHKKTVIVTTLFTPPDGTVQKQIRPFATMTAARLALEEWLAALGSTVVARESTGV